MEPPTAAQVLALAPDPASAKAGQGLANPAKWSALGRDERAVWGECQGSALYRVQADLAAGLACHCSCPSRKFPCKHGLGLLLVLAGNPARVPTAAPAPAWVAEWLSKRDTAAAKKAAPAADAPPADPGTAARRDAGREKRAARREDRVRAGIAEARAWLGDLIRQGLAHAKAQPARFYDALAARLIDAQAPGLARRVRAWPGVLASGDDWASRALEEAGALHWLLHAAGRLDALPDGLRASVRAAVGWTIPEAELLADPGAERITDRWQVVGQRVEEEDKLRVQRTWLAGERTGRAALCLSFAAGGQALDASLVPGTALEAELVFYPSGAPLRAVVRERHGRPAAFGEPAGACADFAETMDCTAALLAGDPWLEHLPWLVRGCTLRRAGEDWTLHDAAGTAVALADNFLHPWPLLAVSGGAPATVFGEWDGRALHPLGVAVRERFVALEGLPT